MRRLPWLRIAGHAGALIPGLVLAGQAWLGALGPDPIGAGIRRSGHLALGLLVLSLVPTAAAALLGIRGLQPLRRILGLYAFLYAVLHLGLLLGVDYAFDLPAFAASLSARFPLAGAGAFLLLLPLALTSTRGWQRRLGHGWKRLHRLAYPAAALAVMHFIWAAKELRPDRLLLGGALLLLLLLRLPPLATWLARRHLTPGG